MIFLFNKFATGTVSKFRIILSPKLLIKLIDLNCVYLSHNDFVESQPVHIKKDKKHSNTVYVINIVTAGLQRH